MSQETFNLLKISIYHCHINYLSEREKSEGIIFHNTYYYFNVSFLFFFLSFFKPSPEDVFLSILEREKVGRKRERETPKWKRNMNRLPPVHAPPGDRTCNLGVLPDWELTLQPFDVHNNAPNKLSHPVRAMFLPFQSKTKVKVS